MNAAGWRWFLSVIVVGLAVCAGTSDAASFAEQWSEAKVGSYVPDDSTKSLVQGDLGTWVVAATIDGTDDSCGPIPHTARIEEALHGRVLHLTSGESTEGCSDNIWAVLFTQFGAPVNNHLSIPITPVTMLSFEEEGVLIDPQKHGWGNSCLVPPCYDNVSLQFEDSAGNVLAYVLQRYPDATPVQNRDRYYEIHLAPEAGFYSRNLFQDFSLIPTFRPNNTIYSIAVTVDEHGWAKFGNLHISDTALPTEPCAPPGAPQVQATDADGRYTVTWTSSSTDGASYELQEATDDGFTANLRTAYSGQALSAPITGRANGGTYYYRVRATKADEYLPSEWVEGTNGCEVTFPPAQVLVKPTAKAFSPKGGAGSVSFTVSGAVGPQLVVPVSVASDTDWVTLDGNVVSVTVAINAKGAGKGKLPFHVGSYDRSSPSPRTATLLVGDQSFTVSQTGVPCTISVTPTSSGPLASGQGGGSFEVAAPLGCGWTASAPATAPWLSVLEPATGEGNGTVTFSAAANPTLKKRTGTITVQTLAAKPVKKTHKVTQAALACLNVAGGWYVHDRATMSCSGAFGSGSRTDEDDGYITITQTACNISFQSPMNTNRSGTIAGSSIKFSGIMALSQPGVVFNKNLLSFSGKISLDTKTINLKGSGTASGTYEGQSGACRISSTEVMTR